jgi:hypothetical protein
MFLQSSPFLSCEPSPTAHACNTTPGSWNLYTTTTTTIKPFYSQASWGRLEMKPHEPKNWDKTRAKKERENKGRQKTKSKKKKRQ